MLLGLKRFLLGLWFLWSCWFTYEANVFSSRDTNIFQSILFAIALFNLIPWLMLYRGRLKREALRYAKKSGDIAGSIEVHGKFLKKMRILGIGLILVAGLFATSWTIGEIYTAPKNIKYQETYLYKSGTPGRLITWTEVSRAGNIPRTWRTCEKINVWVNVDSYPTAIKDVKNILTEINTMTGLNFIYKGVSLEIPPDSEKIAPYNVLVAFYGEEQSKTGFEFGAAIGNAAGFGSGSLTNGYIGLQMPYYSQLPDHFKLQVMNHEFGHVLGLGHTTTKGELMAPMLTGLNVTFNNTVRDYFKAHPGCDRR
jgi:hypothetical protein